MAPGTITPATRDGRWILTCRVQGIDPYVHLVDVLQRVDTHPARDVHLLTPRLRKEHFAKDPLPSDLGRNR